MMTWQWRDKQFSCSNRSICCKSILSRCIMCTAGQCYNGNINVDKRSAHSRPWQMWSRFVTRWPVADLDFRKGPSRLRGPLWATDRRRHCTPDKWMMIFTALHGMQTQSSYENSACPSVCLSLRPSVRLWKLQWFKVRSKTDSEPA